MDFGTKAAPGGAGASWAPRNPLKLVEPKGIEPSTSRVRFMRTRRHYEGLDAVYRHQSAPT